MRTCKGFLLLPVALAVTLLALIALMIANESGVELNISRGEAETAEARLLADAGLNHMLWQLSQNTTCNGYGNLATTPFNQHSYAATVTPVSGSPVTISATGTLSNGVERIVQRKDIRLYQPSKTIVLQPGSGGIDSFIEGESGHEEHNKGDNNELRTSSESDKEYRTLLQFDLSQVPPNATIQSATLELYLQSWSSADTVNAHRLLQAWTEDGVTWDDYDGDNAWSTPGGDFDSAVTGSFLADGIGPKTMEVKGAVQSWVNGSQANNGLILLSPLSSGGSENKYHSSDMANEPHPKLTITYACECGQQCVATNLGKKLLMVVDKPNSLKASESERKTILESWGYEITLIDSGDSQAEFDTALEKNDVVFVPETVNDGTLDNKLTSATIGVVIEENALVDELGLADTFNWVPLNQLMITDPPHYITAPFFSGYRTVSTSSASLAFLSGSLSPDLRDLGNLTIGPGLATLGLDTKHVAGGPVAGRRVVLPWGGDSFDIADLNDDGLTLFQRSLQWGARDPAQCGNEQSLQIKIDSGNDDAEEWISNKSMQLGYQEIVFGWDGSNSTYTMPGLRFKNIDIPAGSEVTGAYIDFSVNKVDNEATDITFWGDNSDNAAAFSNTAGDISSRTSTLETVEWLSVPAWNSIGSKITSPDLSRIVQEIIDRPGWSSGNAIAIMASATGHREAISFNGSPSFAPTLRLVFCSSAAPVEPGLVGHWKLDETSGSVAVDETGNRDGVLENGPVWQPAGKVDGALDFDGFNDRVVVNHKSTFAMTSALTMSAWVYNESPSIASSYRIISKEETGQNDAYWMSFSGGDLYVGIGGSFYTPAMTFNPHQWYHLAATYDSVAAEVRIYVDGTPVLTQPALAPLNANSADVQIGNNWEGKAWEGFLDDIRIYNRTLNASEISALAGIGGGPSSPLTGCSGTYRDEFNTTSFNGNNGTLSWSGDWEEVGESDGATSGDVRITTDLSAYVLRIRDNNNGGEGVQRGADLSGAATAELSFDYRREGLDSSSDYVAILVSGSGTAGPWNELQRIQGGGTDNTYQSYTLALNDHISATTAIRFISSPTMGNSDTVYFDNIQIECAP